MANMTDQRRPHHHLPTPIPIVRARRRLFISARSGAVVVALCPAEWWLATRLLVGWDIGLSLYLVLALRMMAVADVQHIRRRARLQDEGQLVVLALTAVAALASLGAIVALLGSVGGSNRPPAHLLLA